MGPLRDAPHGGSLDRKTATWRSRGRPEPTKGRDTGSGRAPEAVGQAVSLRPAGGPARAAHDPGGPTEDPDVVVALDDHRGIQRLFPPGKGTARLNRSNNDVFPDPDLLDRASRAEWLPSPRSSHALRATPSGCRKRNPKRRNRPNRRIKGHRDAVLRRAAGDSFSFTRCPESVA